MDKKNNRPELNAEAPEEIFVESETAAPAENNEAKAAEGSLKAEQEALQQKIAEAKLRESLPANESEVAELQLRKMEIEKAAQKLLEVAKTKGVMHAVEAARNMNNDALVDKLHDELIANGIIENPKHKPAG